MQHARLHLLHIPILVDGQHIITNIHPHPQSHPQPQHARGAHLLHIPILVDGPDRGVEAQRSLQSAADRRAVNISTVCVCLPSSDHSVIL